MSENNGMISKSEVGGSVSYSEDVIAIMSGLAATEIHGVAGMSGGINSGIVELLGKKDHTTIIHGVNKVSAEIQTNEELRNKIDIITKKINPS